MSDESGTGTKHCPECGREFDHDPSECWDCGVTVVTDDQAGLEGFQ